ncbi:MAG: permease prefix domain 1-containing protein [Bryobacteraceae bacterium]
MTELGLLRRVRPFAVAELQEEMEFHLETKIDDRESAGLTRGRARSEVLREFGNPKAPAKFGISPPDFEMMRQEARSYSGMAAYRTVEYELFGRRRGRARLNQGRCDPARILDHSDNPQS